MDLSNSVVVLLGAINAVVLWRRRSPLTDDGPWYRTRRGLRLILRFQAAVLVLAALLAVADERWVFAGVWTAIGVMLLVMATGVVRGEP